MSAQVLWQNMTKAKAKAEKAATAVAASNQAQRSALNLVKAELKNKNNDLKTYPLVILEIAKVILVKRKAVLKIAQATEAEIEALKVTG